MAVASRPPLRVWVWTAATLALAVVAALLWRGSDAAATDSTTAPPPTGVPTGTPAGTVSAAWSAPGDPVPGDVVAASRVLVGSANGVRALDPLTGEEAWHYTRANARLCGLTVSDGVAVAVFRTEDRCDEAIGLDAGTGVRSWTRNVNFRPDATLSSTGGTVLAHSPTGLVALDPVGNNTRWRHAPPSGCELLASAPGDTGVALLQQCAGSPDPQLRLLDSPDGGELWTRELPVPDGAEVRLLDADLLVGVQAGDEVQLVTAADGTLLTTLPADAGRPAQQTAVGGTVLVTADGTLTALDPATGQRRWTAPATGLPGEPVDGNGPPALTVPTDAGFVQRDAGSGDELATWSVPGLPEGGTATALGPAVVLRLADRVTGYR
ncbi:PQQ-binding-like beta-propeller repeat protein [Blastococcus xanthinilyticus]|uniref:Outer membrane protein assembly factor BamB n=1 Tax=Blastococcus xanthinilyticus TaxID=1564164 RepID=A0A5S5D1M3_9ACTN|nr:PQQ-binding-like beta-propeller repeat protein [Blastococcus xanthinilyticus]TYP89920.1 outer membrane protein assembly factor BamB [Blastococcus xanthinilyticus]